eukprot:scaffold12857_cov135-Isochrysis_galbana.AAC.1
MSRVAHKEGNPPHPRYSAVLSPAGHPCLGGQNNRRAGGRDEPCARDVLGLGGGAGEGAGVAAAVAV